MPDPGAQYIWDMLSARALNPDKPLPLIADEVKNLLELPKDVREKCKPVVEKIKNLFSLEKEQPLKTRK
jgi:phage-related protein